MCQEATQNAPLAPYQNVSKNVTLKCPLAGSIMAREASASENPTSDPLWSEWLFKNIRKRKSSHTSTVCTRGSPRRPHSFSAPNGEFFLESVNRFVYVTKGDSLGLKFGSKSYFQFLLMNISDITERYREDPQDARVLADRKVDVIIHVASADQKPDMALFDLIKTAVTRSKDQAVKRKYSRYYR